jgi:hypothetical protein
MTTPRCLALCFVSLALLAAACLGTAEARTTNKTVVGAVERPTITIQSPVEDETIQGVAIIRFRTENISISSPFDATKPAGPYPAGHVHVTVDDTSWHWMHTTSDPVVITPLSAGEHTVTLELAGADHRPLAVQAVRFRVLARPAAGTIIKHKSR